MDFSDSVTVLKSIGEKRALIFGRMGIFTVKDLLNYYPRDYEDRSRIKKMNELVVDAQNTFIGLVRRKAENIVLNGKTLTKLRLSDETGEMEIVWFNQPYLKNTFLEGNQYIFYGKVAEKYGRLQMSAPEYEIFGEGELLNAGRIVPVYRLTAGINQKSLRRLIKSALDETHESFAEVLPKSVIEKYGLKPKSAAIENIHFPKSDEDFWSARETLVFEELYLLQSALYRLKGKHIAAKSEIVFKDTDFSEIEMPFELTKAQKKVIEEIENDFRSGYQMNRLIQGDVGSGKTMVALISCFMAIRNGYQACIMAPTEVLANQHFEYFSGIFAGLGIKTVLLTGSMTKRQRRFILEDISCGFAPMVVGTHALIQEGVSFDNLGLVITDEQHRFGVRQRELLSKKGSRPHVLVMTATPIPRTLALILYGDLDISVINELPPGRQKIDTFAVNSSYRERLREFIRKEVQKGRQVYIICPTIEDNEKSDLKAVKTYTEKLKEELPEIQTEYIHGKMSQVSKNGIMDKFSKNEISVIVSTTVIEVGVNVPNATLMIIENADRFGLSALHQLRGRVGRGSEKSYCVLVSDTKNPKTKERLKALTKSGDGFYISELDLELRGPGDFFGTRQHGIPEMKIANLYKDAETLKKVQLAIEQEPITAEEQKILDSATRDFLFSGNDNLAL